MDRIRVKMETNMGVMEFGLYGKHSIFGELISAEVVLDKIGNVETGKADRPVEDVIIEKVSVV